MKILFATSEVAPFSRTGGLAVVSESLPRALRSSGEEIEVISPLYRCVRDNFDSRLKPALEREIVLGRRQYRCVFLRTEYEGITHWFIENDDLFDRQRLYGYDDDKLRFAFFSKAVVELLPERGADILHCNDWETALAVVYLMEAQRRGELRNVRTVYTIHNLAYQGHFGAYELGETFGLSEDWYDRGLGYLYEGRRDVNLTKGAMLLAGAVSTVSPSYASEICTPRQGEGLDEYARGVRYKLYGILNGIETERYDPGAGPDIAARYSPDDLSGKSVCKAALQRRYGLTEDPDAPLLAAVARITEQKGIELFQKAAEGLMDLGVQIVILGESDNAGYTAFLRSLSERWPGRAYYSDTFSETAGNAVFAGADFYLMPSRFEPCGLSQMMAMRFGTVPIVHATGGLKDTVRPFNGVEGDGFTFASYEPGGFYLAIRRAVKLYRGDRESFRALQRRGMKKDFSWTKSAAEYRRMYGKALLPWEKPPG